MINPLEAARLSARAYDEVTIEKSGVQVHITNHGDTRAFAVRGTEFDELEDVIRDMRAIPWYSDELGMMCHAGFLKGARAVFPLIRPYINKYEGPSFLFTGHSKGGAIAQKLGAMIAMIYGIRPQVITFGSPRVAFSGLDKILPNVQLFRNGSDCVPSHPWPLWGYRHAANLIQIGKPRHRFKDHRISSYITSLDKLERERTAVNNI